MALTDSEAVETELFAQYRVIDDLLQPFGRTLRHTCARIATMRNQREQQELHRHLPAAGIAISMVANDIGHDFIPEQYFYAPGK
ncbi:hypothetical protein MMOR_27390 [Mycolicibacterium moriokaense]|uniref:Uncharacterized protein n=1 Tax=Mycolicibacterium moriokaense TaxID=39691 RepID=A0AAD1M626_9MYCO|nr:hypothetical protein MMOR_27390 [Mycolicibacterium moriokaense]